MTEQVGSGELHSKHVVVYKIRGQRVAVDLNWQGEKPEDDPDRFYDLYDADTGDCLNQGDPWHDDDEGIPSIEDVTELLNSKGGV